MLKIASYTGTTARVLVERGDVVKRAQRQPALDHPLRARGRLTASTSMPCHAGVGAVTHRPAHIPSTSTLPVVDDAGHRADRRTRAVRPRMLALRQLVEPTRELVARPRSGHWSESEQKR